MLYIIILVPVVIAGLNALQLDAITQPASAMLGKILAALPLLFGAGLLLVIFYVVAKAIRQSEKANASLLATVARIVILVLAGAMALRQMNVANEIVNLAFGLFIGAVAVAGNPPDPCRLCAPLSFAIAKVRGIARIHSSFANPEQIAPYARISNEDQEGI